MPWYPISFCQLNIQPCAPPASLIATAKLFSSSIHRLEATDYPSSSDNDCAIGPLRRASPELLGCLGRPSAKVLNMANRNMANEYFVPGDGIDREVITEDICRYLGNDAVVRPGV